MKNIISVDSFMDHLCLMVERSMDQKKMTTEQDQQVITSLQTKEFN
jgi:hypothetical protein